MDLDLLRSILTAASFVCFLGICVWAYSARAKARFEEAASLPFTPDEMPAAPAQGTQS